MDKTRARRGTKQVFRRAKPGGGLYDGWYVRWTDGTGKRRQAFGGRTFDAARGFLRRREDEKDRQRVHGERPVQLQSLEDFLPTLLAHLKATTRPATVNGRAGLLKSTATHFGRTPMARITQSDVTTWLMQVRTERNLKASTLATWRTGLASAFAVAISLGRARVNPVHGIKLPKVDEKPVPRLTPDELQRIYAAMPPLLRPCVVLMGELGLRRGEVVDLTWTAFDPGLGV